MFGQHYIIIDDFYPDPMQIRHLAISMEKNQGTGNYAGVMTQEPLFTPAHTQILQEITNEPVEGSPGLNGYFRFTMENDRWTQHIHFDPKIGQIWAGLVYLSAPDDLQRHEARVKTGTNFWRHNRTGLNSIPLTQQGLELHGWTGEHDLKVFLDTEGMDESLWTHTLYIPAQFNRLVLFRPWLFHSPGRAFGDRLDNCRLVQLFFLRLKGTQENIDATDQNT